MQLLTCLQHVRLSPKKIHFHKRVALLSTAFIRSQVLQCADLKRSTKLLLMQAPWQGQGQPYSQRPATHAQTISASSATAVVDPNAGKWASMPETGSHKNNRQAGKELHGKELHSTAYMAQHCIAQHDLAHHSNVLSSTRTVA